MLQYLTRQQARCSARLRREGFVPEERQSGRRKGFDVGCLLGELLVDRCVEMYDPRDRLPANARRNDIVVY